MAKTLNIPKYIYNHKSYADWEKFNLRNPNILAYIVKELRRAKIAGRKKASVKAIINFLRWNMYIDSGDEYKINDKYTGIYTHVIIYNFPDIAKMLEKRVMRSLI
jgi:hypothetical protein